ncbi:hypothetical protein EFK07_12305 [Pseudomonas putida]|uniref:Secreted protein n=1 Tax=Pseudomonas putida TaxID=303 RepID=A0A3M8T591_PSEPU|nr:hypothetical protein EFK07_12305 [Pseudomonas putida]
MSRKGCKAAPAMCASVLNPWGCLAALSRHKAAPTGDRAGPGVPHKFQYQAKYLLFSIAPFASCTQETRP